ncbi:hypothetical protein CEP53_008991 [Fusarium sp. AF-6]|nr:hypothetical protein CEP53_008991 [Fusarium sp. AF-6]
MTYSSSGPSLAQALDMDVDPSSSTLPLASSSSSPSSSDLPGPASASASHHSRSASHPHYHARSNSASDDTEENDDEIDDNHSHSHVHRAHIHLHHLRDTTVDANDHDQLHNDGHHSHHSHHRLHRRKSPPNLDLHVPQDGTVPANDLKPRAELVTQVVQTVSLVQVVDSAGSPIELQTHIGAPATVVVDSASGVTVAISNPDPSPSVAAAASNPAATYNVPPASSDSAPAVETDTPDMTEPEPSTNLPDASVSQSVPDAVSYTTLEPTSDVLYQSFTGSLPETSDAPTSSEPETTSQETASTEATSSAIDTTSELSGSQNSTTATATTEDLTTTSANPTTLTDITTDLTSEATSEPTTDASATESSESVLKQSLSTTNTPQTGTSSTITIVSSTFITSSIEAATTDASQLSLSDSVYSSIAEESWTSTWWGGDYSEGGGGGGYGSENSATVQAQPPAATTTGSSNDTEPGALSPQQKQVIGGVVGSVAGVAFLALLVMFAFRYKRKHTSGLLGENQTTRAIGGPGGESGGAMSERAGGFSVAAALAGLTRKKQQAPEPEPTGERGFYRVSGKKLPSVLQVGGDGYSDPRTNRESVMSGHSDYWRGSMAFDPGDRDSNRLALGSPMRPVSGVPVIRTGPARTPITESNPFSDPPTRPRPDSDALGGSVGGGSQDGSVGSPPSRFRERI